MHHQMLKQQDMMPHSLYHLPEDFFGLPLSFSLSGLCLSQKAPNPQPSRTRTHAARPSVTLPQRSLSPAQMLQSGVKILLENCKTWFSDAASSAMSPLIPLDDLISIWNFGIKHDIDFLPELCESYLAKNFMWAVSCKSFVDVPYSLLLGCIKHQHLTIESEVHLSDALLIWLDANTGDSEGLSTSDNYYGSILEQLHCLGILLKFEKDNPSAHIEDKFGLISNLVEDLQLPK
ncbi:hypothetical protein TIFTF001_030866 [Ficus carica]|uniref:BACK domain-containing protein n=1 Tax=Ficus carica TaxID=3494 RepID=A0AA88DU40_FICCA|nr:hypothetical protein TIFTF001_030866 [Ficus carica]